MSGTGNVGAVNKANDVVSFCQTVLPGNEAMLIPTSVAQFETLTVPGPNYWCSTAAQYVKSAPFIWWLTDTIIASTSILRALEQKKRVFGDRKIVQSVTGVLMLLARTPMTRVRRL